MGLLAGDYSSKGRVIALKEEAGKHESCGTHGHSLHQVTGRCVQGGSGVTSGGGKRQSLIRSAAAFANMRPVLLRVGKTK